jgi:hypothetical protein
MPDKGIVFPPGYTSPDVIDHRNGQGPTLMERIRDLVNNVRNDYNDTLKGQPTMAVGQNDAYAQGLNEDAVKRIHARVRGMFQEGS